jgi:hypothetical protein
VQWFESPNRISAHQPIAIGNDAAACSGSKLICSIPPYTILPLSLTLLDNLRQLFPGGSCLCNSAWILFGASFGARSATICHCGGRRVACECAQLQPTPAFARAMAWQAAASTVSVRAKRLHHSFGANDATIFSKRGSPRSGSHIGLKRKLP